MGIVCESFKYNLEWIGVFAEGIEGLNLYSVKLISGYTLLMLAQFLPYLILTFYES